MYAKAPRPRRRTPATTVPSFSLYGEPPSRPAERTVHVETIASRSRLHSWTIRPHRHRDLYQVLVLWRGSVTAEYDDVTTVLSGAAYVIVPPLAVHSFVFSRDTDGFVATFGASLGRQLAEAALGKPDALRQPRSGDLSREIAVDLHTLGAMMLRESARPGRGHDAALGGLLTTIVSLLLRTLPPAAALQPGTQRRAAVLVARYREVLEHDYAAQHAVGDYARRLRTSETALRRACQRVAGQSPNAMLHARLLVEAERLLRYTGLSVGQIAYQLGFRDPAYFSRFFSHRSGLSPSAYRAGGTPG